MSEDQRLADVLQLWRVALQRLQESTAENPSRRNLSNAVYTMVTVLRGLTHQTGIELVLTAPLPLVESDSVALAGRYVGHIWGPRVYRQGDTAYVVVTLQRECRPDLDIMLPSPDSFVIRALA